METLEVSLIMQKIIFDFLEGLSSQEKVLDLPVITGSHQRDHRKELLVRD